MRHSTIVQSPQIMATKKQIADVAASAEIQSSHAGGNHK